MRRNTSNVDRSEKGKDIVRYGAQSNSGPASSKVGYGSRVMFCLWRKGAHLRISTMTGE